MPQLMEFLIGIIVGAAFMVAAIAWSRPTVSETDFLRFCIKQRVELAECRTPVLDTKTGKYVPGVGN